MRLYFANASLRARPARPMIDTPIEYSALSARRLRSSAGTHPGTVRERNEDNYVDRPDLGLWAVADGAGGHKAGDVAARVVTDVLKTIPTGFGGGELLAEVRRRMARAHEVLWGEAAKRGGDA